MTRKKKLVVILGSGSSMPLGFPSVDELGQLTRKWAAEWNAARGWPDYFAELWAAMERYQLPEVHSWFPPVNYERVLGGMLALSHWVTPSPSGDPLRSVTGNALRRSPFPEPEAHGPEIILRKQLGHLIRGVPRREQRIGLAVLACVRSDTFLARSGRINPCRHSHD